MRNLQELKLGIIGLGYVGLPLAVEFGKHYDTVGFDIHAERVEQLRAGRDKTLEVDSAELARADRLRFSARVEDLAGCNRLYRHRAHADRLGASPRPHAADQGQRDHRRGLKPGDIVVYESTVYPGCTEEVCVPILERMSGLGFNTRLLRRLQSRADQPRGQGTPGHHHPEGHLRLDPGNRRLRRPPVRLDHHRRHAQGQLASRWPRRPR